jgi:hypothetical protein
MGADAELVLGQMVLAGGAADFTRRLPGRHLGGRGQTILLDRERIKRQTLQQRCLIHQQRAA